MHTREVLRRPGAGGVAGGIEAFVGGIGFIVGTPAVWGYALVPAAMMVLLGCGLMGAGIYGAHRLSHAYFGDDLGAWGWVVLVALYVVVVLAAAILALCLAQPFSGFALERIVHAQEYALTGGTTPAPGVLVSFFHAAKVAFVTLTVGVLVLGPLFVINLFFPPAAVVTVPVKFLICGWLLAWDFFDYPLTVHGLGVRARMRWIADHFLAFTTFGLLWVSLIVVPGVVLLLLPMGVAGATRVVVKGGPLRWDVDVIEA